jgi:FKBP-type peptidyl-prolyl cis-trans isomerase
VRAICLLLCLAIVLPVWAAEDTASPLPETEEQKVFYAMGLALARNLQGIQLSTEELNLISQGLMDGALGNEPKVDLQVYGPRIEPLLSGRIAAAADREKNAAQEFLAEVAQQEGAVKSENGLIFFDLQPGTGGSPSTADTVRLHYHGTLRDGTVFDSSRDKEPVEFDLGQVVPCFREGLTKMKVGGKAKVVCPADLAYGDRGVPNLIPPGAALVFELELLEIIQPAATETAPSPPTP